MSLSTHFKGYGMLRIALNISGIVLFQRPSKKITGKICMFISPIIFHLFLLYIICANTYLVARKKAPIEVLGWLTIICVTSIVLWHNVSRKQFCIRNLIATMYEISHLQNKQKSYLEKAINFLLALFTLFIVLSGISCTIFLTEPNYPYQDYFTFFVNSSRTINLFIRIIFCQLFFVGIYLLPAILAVLCLAVYCKCGDMLHNFCEDLEIFLHRTPHRRNVKKLMKMHKLLFQTCTDIEKIFSSTSLLLIFSQIFCMYVGLFAFIIIPNEYMFKSTLMECVPSVTLAPVALISIVVSASKISTQSGRIRKVLQLVYNNYIEKADVEKETKVLLKAMLNTTFPTMTAYGLMELKPGLTLSIFGSLMTYALLILSVKFSNFKAETDLSIQLNF